MSRIVFAIDVGFGNVKHTFPVKELTGEIRTACFPSLAPISTTAGMSARGAPGLTAADVIDVPVNNCLYTVGPDALLATKSGHTRTLDHTYSKSNEYMALVIGALHYGKAPAVIDILVLGLPVAAHADLEQREAMRKRFHRQFVLPDGRTVSANRVLVLPQPLGAYYELTKDDAPPTPGNYEVVGVLDSGFLTTDWIIMIDGKKSAPRSSSHDGGVSGVLAEISNLLKRDFGRTVSDPVIDRALRKGGSWKISLGDQEVDLRRYEGFVNAKIQEAVRAMKNCVGEDTPIQRLFVTGGGSDLFLPQLREAFTAKIIVAQNAMYSNVRGFARTGLSQLSKLPASPVAGD